MILNIYHQEGEAVIEKVAVIVYSRATCKIWRHYLHFPEIHSSLFLFGSMDIQTKSCQELSSQHLGKKQKGTVIYIFGPTFSGSSFQPLLHWRINGVQQGYFSVSPLPILLWMQSFWKMQFPGHCFWCMKLSRWQEYGTLHSMYNTATQLKRFQF